MAKTLVENYSTAPRNYSNGMVKNNIKKPKDSSNSTRGSSMSSSDEDLRKAQIASSMRKFLDDDDEYDYLGSLVNGKSKNPTSSRRGTASYRRKGVPRTSSSKSSRPISIRKRSKSDDSIYEGSLNDEKPPSSSGLRDSARRLMDKAKRAVSPGRLRRDRSKSPSPQKTRESIRNGRSTSPTDASPGSPPRRKRSKSPGKLKKRVSDSRENLQERPRSSKSRSRSKSPGKMKDRSKSPGRMKERSRSKSPGRMKERSRSKSRAKSPGALRKDRPRRKPDHSEDDSNHTSTSRRRARSNGPMSRKSERVPRSKRDGKSSRHSRRARSNDEFEGDTPVKERSASDHSRYKVKRNKSMDTAMALQVRRATQDLSDEEDKMPPRRANSMMLSREKGRRGKSNSLADLVQYKEDEIHSTSYFASNHVLVNRERMKRGLRPLTRNIAMDELARKSAEAMAETNGLNPLPATYVGNVLRGETIRTIHRSTMLQKQGRERANILNPYFQDFGVGTCKGSDGQLYMCQLFSERLELALTDTTKMDENKDDE